MHNDHIYNLMAQLVEEQRSLYRIQNMYKQDALKEDVDATIWESLESQKKENVQLLTTEIKKYL